MATRFGYRPVMLAMAIIMTLVFPLLPVSMSALMLGAELFVFGAAIGAMDCVINMQAIIVERVAG